MSSTLLHPSPAILHVVLRPRYSGAEMLVKALIPLHAENGCRTAFCALLPTESAFQPELEKLDSLGCELFVPNAELKGLQRIHHVTQAIREFQPNLIVAHSVIPAAYARAAAVLSGWRITPHDDRRLAIALHSADNDDFAALPFHLSEKVLTYFADTVVTVSDESLKNYRHRVRAHPHLQRIANGIDLSRFRAAAARRSALRDQFGLGGQRLVLQVGRLTEVKQQMLSLEALIPLLHEDPKLQLWFAGLPEEPEYEVRLREAVQASGLTAQVQILGSRTDVPELLAAADVYLMPSTMEAHSVALIEALASGVPVVASDIATFLYTASLPGVSLVGTSDGAGLVKATQGFLARGTRFERDLGAYDIAATEQQYRGLV